MNVDYFVVTALREESEAIERYLTEIQPEGPEGFYVGTLKSDDKVTSRRVLYYQPGSGQGTKPAQWLADEGIRHGSPGALLLVGIAGGFHEHEICLGDVLVPETIDSYEFAKRTPEKVERREPPFRVTARRILWIAKSIAASGECWYKNIRERRPNERERSFPLIHAPDRGVLGSGDKNLADERAEERRYLKETHGSRAIGFDMEAAGVAFTCLERQVPFAVVKGVQDNGTSDKDEPIVKDQWRIYAADAAATLAALLMLRWAPCILPTPEQFKDYSRVLMKKFIRSRLDSSLYPSIFERIQETAQSAYEEGGLGDRERLALCNEIRELISEELPALIDAAYGEAIEFVAKLSAIDAKRTGQELQSYRNELQQNLPSVILSEIESWVMTSPTHLLVCIKMFLQPKG